MKTGSKKAFFGQKSEIKYKIALGWLFVFVLTALLSPVLPLPFLPNTIDAAQVYQPPFSGNHFLGTDHLGRDVLANLLYGAFTALWISVPVMLLTTLLGVAAGAVAAYYGNHKIRLSGAFVMTLTVISFLFLFYIFYQKQYIFRQSSSSVLTQFLIETGQYIVVLSLSGYLLYVVLKKIPVFRKGYPVPADSILLKLTELTASLPRLILLLAFAAFFNASVFVVLAVIMLTNWAVSARLVRAEILKLKEQEFIAAAEVAGIPAFRILYKHLLPNALSPVILAFTFGVASLMALEATLSFLGIGIPADVPTWGRLISGARLNLQAWWLLVFPGIFLVCTILSLHTLAGILIKRMRKQAF